MFLQLLKGSNNFPVTPFFKGLQIIREKACVELSIKELSIKELSIKGFGDGEEN